MSSSRYNTVLVACIMIASVLGAMVPGVIGGADTFVEEFDDSVNKEPSSTVAGWNNGEVSLSRVDPVNISAYDTVGWGRDLEVEGDFTFISDGSSGLLILNISDVYNPTFAGSYSSGFFTYSLAMDGNIALLSEWGRIRVVNITNPYNPSLLTTYNIGMYAYEMTMEGDWLFTASMMGGVYAINFTDPTSAGPSYQYNTPNWAYDIDVDGDMAYVADYNTIQVLNVSDPTSMSLVSTITPPMASTPRCMGVSAEGDVLYLTCYEWVNPRVYYVFSYDITDPSSPVYLDNTSIIGTLGYTYDIEVDGNYAYVGAYTDGVYIVNISDPANMNFLDSNRNTNGYTYEIKKRGTELFVMDGQAGLEILNVSSMITPASKSTYNTPGSAREVFLQGNFAYVADSGGGLQIVNITDPESLTLEGSLATAGTWYGIWASGDYAYVAADTQGLHLINITDTSSPSLIGTYDSPNNARDVMVKHKTAYLADYSGGLRVIDVEDPASPTQLGNYDTTGNANGVWVSGNVAYVADDTNGLVSVAITDPTAPVLLDTYDTGGSAMDVQVECDIAYVADGTAGLVTLDVSDPSNIVLADTYNTDGSAEGVYVSGNYAFVADDDGGLVVINVSDPWTLTKLDDETSMSDAFGVAAEGNYVYVANLGAGLVSVEMFDNVADTFESVGFAESTTVDTTPYLIVAATLAANETKPGGTDIYYNLTNDGGATWSTVSLDTLFYFPDFASDLRWRANMTTSDTMTSPFLQNVTVTYYYDDVDPESNATDGAPDYDNEGTISVKWQAMDPFPATGIDDVRLFFRYDANYDGDFTDLGDIDWTFTGLPLQSSTSGTFYFNPEDNNGMYEFYTIALDNASWLESAPVSADDSTMFDNVLPNSDCYGGTPTYANSGTITVWYNSSDPSPGSGINEITLYYRLDSNNDGDFTDVGDTEWADTGLAAQTTESGSFSFNPQGKDGRYEFFTLGEDNATNMEKYPPVRDSFTVFDSHAPVSNHYIGGAQTASGWYIGAVYVFLSAEDVTSGVNITKYRVDDSEWRVYNDPFIIATDGSHKVEYYSNDMAHNDEGIQEFNVTIDNGAPETGYQLEGTLGNNGWYVSDVTVTMTSNDDLSGINKTRYRINGGTWQAYSAPFTLDENGGFDVDYYSFDNAGNDEEKGNFKVKIDKAGPSIAHSIIGNPSDNGVYPSEVTVMVFASDAMSGISMVEYRFTGLDWAPYSSPFVLSADGNHTFQYRATDVAGNVVNSGYVNVEIDTTPPEVDIAIAGEKTGSWYTSAVDVTVTASDEGTDVAEILVSVDRGPWQTYTGAIKVSEPGIHTIDAKAMDNVGHESAMGSVGFKIDNKVPMTIESHGGTMGKNGWYITDVQVTLTATDDLSGVDNMTYRVDAGAWTNYGGPITLSTDGTHKVEYYSVDLAGNKEAAKTTTIKVDKTPPELVFTSHSDGDVVSTAAATLKGRTGTDATLLINDEAVTVVTGTFSKAYTLVEGENTFKALAEDAAGHMAEAEITLVLDTTPPTIILYSPTVNMRTTSDSVLIQGSTEPGSVVTINGEAVPVDEYGSFSKTMALEIGTVTVTVKVTDPKGNEGEVTRDVTRDKVKKEETVQTASEAMPSFILAVILVAVIVAILAFMMGRKMGQTPVEEEIESTTPRRVRRVARPPPPEDGGDLSSMESEGEMGASDMEWADRRE